MNLELNYVYQQTGRALYALAVGAGCVQDRLITAAGDALSHLNRFMGGLPDDLRVEYGKLMTDLGALDPDGRGRLDVSISCMPDDEAVHLAHRVHEFASRVAATYRGER